MVAYGKMPANSAASSVDVKYAVLVVPLESIIRCAYQQPVNQIQDGNKKSQLEPRYSLENPDVVREGIYHNIRLMNKLDVAVPNGLLVEINDALNTYSRFARSIDNLKTKCDYKRFIQEIGVIVTPNAANGRVHHEVYDSDMTRANNALLNDLNTLKTGLTSLSTPKKSNLLSNPKDYDNKRKDYIVNGIKRFSDDFQKFIQLAGQKIRLYSADKKEKEKEKQKLNLTNQAMNTSGYLDEFSLKKEFNKSNNVYQTQATKTLSDKIYDSYALLMSEDCKLNKKMHAKTLYELARSDLSEVELYQLNNRIGSLSIKLDAEKEERKKEEDAQKKSKFINGLESIVGFSKDYEKLDDMNREYALRNIALLAYSGVKKQLKDYSELGPDLKKIVNEYSDNLDFRTKFAGAGKNNLLFAQVDTQFDMYKFVHDKRLNENMKYKDIAVAARREMIDYLTKNLEFSQELSIAEMRTTIDGLLPSQDKFMSQSTMKRMIDTYKTYSEQNKEKSNLSGFNQVEKSTESNAEPFNPPRVLSMADFKSRKEKESLKKENELKQKELTFKESNSKESNPQEPIADEFANKLRQKFQQQRN